MSGKAWGKGSGFIARSAEHRDGMYSRQGGEVLRGSPSGKQGGGGCIALHFFCVSLGLYGCRAPAL